MTAILVVITWIDAKGTTTKVYEKAVDHKPDVMHTVGWLVDRDGAGVFVCGERFSEDGQWCYRGHTFIPRALVKKVDRLQ